MSDDVRTIGGHISISNQLLSDAVKTEKALFEAFNDALINPPTADQIAAQRAEREALWDENTAAGLIGIDDDGGYESGPDWRRVDRGCYVEKWVAADVWDRYSLARLALEAIEDEIDP